MSLAPLRSLPAQLAALRPALGAVTARGFATGDPLKDPRTTSAQQRAHETDEATKDSVGVFSPPVRPRHPLRILPPHHHPPQPHRPNPAQPTLHRPWASRLTTQS